MPNGNEARVAEEKRVHARFPAGLAASVYTQGSELPCLIFDLSAGGAKLKLQDGAEMEGGGWRLDVPLMGTYPVRFRWLRSGFTGVSFEITEDGRDELAAEIAEALGGTWAQQAVAMLEAMRPSEWG